MVPPNLPSYECINTSGREACTRDMGLEDVGVKIDSESRYIIGGHKDFETSSVPHIHAIGDVLKVSINYYHRYEISIIVLLSQLEASYVVLVT